jgi:hypothetical protein
MAKKLTLRQVKAILQGEKADSLSTSAASKLSNDRTTALNYYLGDMETDFSATEGRSRVVSTDVSDVVDGLMPALMDIFCSGDTVAKFNPVAPDDIGPAEQETEYVNHVFMEKNPGYRIIHDMFKDALISKTGIVKVWWETKEDEEEETYFDQDEEALAILVSKPDMEVVAHTANEDGTHDVTLVKRRGYGCAKVVNVPPEEFGVARRTRRLQETPYCFHEPGGGVPENELIADGYDADQVKKLSTWSENRSRGTEAMARDTVDENATQGAGDAVNRGQRPVRITEHFILMDYEGKGKTCRYKIVTGDEGEVLLKDGKPDIEKIEYVPFAVAHPDPMPHRFFGRAIADKVIETQRVKTALTRGVLDNMYLINNQQMEVNEQFASDSTIDDLLNRRIGGIVRTKGPGAVNPIVVQPIADKLFPALEYFDREREWRSGVTREGQGLDAEALQNQSATAARQVHSASQAKMKLIARNLADGVEDLFWLLHAVIRKNGSKPETVRLRNEWHVVDPRLWRTRDDMSITVGLGSGGKQEQLQGLQMLIQAQMSAAENPPMGLVSPKNFYNAAKEMVKLLDLKDVSLYFNDPGDGPMPEPPPPPELQKAQMEGQIKQQEMQMKAQIEKLQAEADIATNQRKVEADLMMNREKNAQEMQMKREEHAMRMEEMRMKLVGQAAQADMKQQDSQMKLYGQAAQTAMKGSQTGGDGKAPAKPNMELIDRIMSGAQTSRPSGPKKKRMKKVGPGEWEVEETN